MKKLFYTITTIFFLSACEDVIDVDLKEVDPILVVDAWLEHTPGEQEIRLTYTRPYFDNT